MQEIVEQIFLKLKELPNGTEISTAGLLGESSLNKYTSSELFEIHKLLKEKCKVEGIKLNMNQYSEQYVGLPYNIPFIKE